MLVRPLSHRLSCGRCRDCGYYDSFSAPDGCTRCAVDRMREHGHEIVVNPVAQFAHVADELWREVAAGIQNGSIKSDRFYIMVGHNDGGCLSPPLGDLSPGDWEVGNARMARTIAVGLARRYPQVWVVTTVGCWNASTKN